MIRNLRHENQLVLFCFGIEISDPNFMVDSVEALLGRWDDPKQHRKIEVLVLVLAMELREGERD